MKINNFRGKICKTCSKNADSSVVPYLALRRDYVTPNHQTAESNNKSLHKFQDTGSVTDIVDIIVPLVITQILLP